MMQKIILWLDGRIFEPLDQMFCAGLDRLLDMCLEWQKKSRAEAVARAKQRAVDARLRKLAQSKIDPNAQCLACGEYDCGEIKYDPTIQRVIHRCKVCNALRPEKPVYPVEVWDFVGRDMKKGKEREKEVMARFDDNILVDQAAQAKQEADARKKVETVH